MRRIQILIASLLVALISASCGPSEDTVPIQNNASEYISYKIDGKPIVYLSKVAECVPLYNDSLQKTIYHYEGYDTLGKYMILDSDNKVAGTYKYPNFYISQSTISDGPKIGDDISFTINKFGAIGDYIDIDFSGTYTTSQNVSHSISGKIHVMNKVVN